MGLRSRLSGYVHDIGAGLSWRDRPTEPDARRLDTVVRTLGWWTTLALVPALLLLLYGTTVFVLVGGALGSGGLVGFFVAVLLWGAMWIVLGGLVGLGLWATAIVVLGDLGRHGWSGRARFFLVFWMIAAVASLGAMILTGAPWVAVAAFVYLGVGGVLAALAWRWTAAVH